MKLSETQQRQINDQSWNWAIQSGREELGNLEVNLRFLNQTGLLQPDMTALELGCGTGTLTETLYRRGIHILGSDISEVAITYGRNKFPHLDLSVQSAEQLPWKTEQFDVVLSFDVFEHLFEPDKHLDEVRRVLKGGGYYLFQTPNKLTNSIYETLKTRSLGWKQYHPSLHSPRQLRKRLEKKGFSVQFVKMNILSDFTRKKLANRRWLLAVLKWIDFRYLPLWLQTNLYIIARKQ